MRRVCFLGPEFSQILWNPNIDLPSPKIQSNPPSLNEKNPFYICPYLFFKMPYVTVIHQVYNYFLETIPVFHVSTSPNPQSGTPLVVCPRLLIQYIHSYPPYWRPFLHLQPEHTPCCGDRHPTIKAPGHTSHVTRLKIWCFVALVNLSF